MNKETIGYFLIAVSFIALITHINELFHSFSYGYYQHTNTILFIVEVFLFAGIKLLPVGSYFKTIGKVIFILVCFIFLMSSVIYFSSSVGLLFFMQSLIAGIFAHFCTSSNHANSNIAFVLRIFAGFIFIFAVVFRCQDFSYHNDRIVPFLVALAFVLLIIGLAQILNPISKTSSIKL